MLTLADEDETMLSSHDEPSSSLPAHHHGYIS